MSSLSPFLLQAAGGARQRDLHATWRPAASHSVARTARAQGPHCGVARDRTAVMATPHCGATNTALRCAANTAVRQFLTALRRLFTALRSPHPRTAVPSPSQCGAITPSHCGAVAPALRRARTALRHASPARADRTAGAECGCVGSSYCVGCSPAPSYYEYISPRGSCLCLPGEDNCFVRSAAPSPCSAARRRLVAGRRHVGAWWTGVGAINSEVLVVSGCTAAHGAV